MARHGAELLATGIPTGGARFAIGAVMKFAVIDIVELIESAFVALCVMISR